MAEGLARQILGTKATVRSAGSEPKAVNSFAVKVLEEIGIDISKATSKTYEELSPTFLEALDCVVTLCAEEVCPVVVSRARKLHWPLSDPASATGSEEDRLQAFRRTRDRIREKILSEFGGG